MQCFRACIQLTDPSTIHPRIGGTQASQQQRLEAQRRATDAERSRRDTAAQEQAAKLAATEKRKREAAAFKQRMAEDERAKAEQVHPLPWAT